MGIFAIRNANSVVNKTIENKNIPIPKWTDTRTACNFKSITKAPKVICVITNAVARELVILIFKSEFLLIKLATIVEITKIPTLAAINLWVHSTKYSADGMKPFGHCGHSGQVSPSPDAEMYPPINIKEYKTTRVDNARYWIAKIILR